MSGTDSTARKPWAGTLFEDEYQMLTAAIDRERAARLASEAEREKLRKELEQEREHCADSTERAALALRRVSELERAEATAKALQERLAQMEADAFALAQASLEERSHREADWDAQKKRLAEVERERDEARAAVAEHEQWLANACSAIDAKASNDVEQEMARRRHEDRWQKGLQFLTAKLAAAEQEASRLRKQVEELEIERDLPPSTRREVALSPSAAQPAQEQLSKKERSHEAKGIEPPRHAGVGAGDESDRDTANTGSKGQGGQSDGNSAGHPGRIPQETAPQDVSDRGAPPALAQAFREGAEAMRERCADAAPAVVEARAFLEKQCPAPAKDAKAPEGSGEPRTKFFWVAEHRAPGARGGPCYMIEDPTNATMPISHSSSIEAAKKFSTKAECEAWIRNNASGWGNQALEHGWLEPAAQSGQDKLSEEGVSVWLVLSAHYLAGIECDHAKKQDRASCACSAVALPWQPSVGAAVESWIAHVKEVVASANSGHRSPPIGAATPGTMSNPGMVPAQPGEARCSFCENRNALVPAGRLLTVGGRAYICLNCAQLAVDVLQPDIRLPEPTEARQTSPAPPTSPASADATEEPAK